MAEERNDENVLMLEDEEGNVTPFELIGSCELDGNVYHALMPIENNQDQEYVILKETVAEDGEASFVTIDSDEEFDRVADFFDDSIFGEVDYDQE